MNDRGRLKDSKRNHTIHLPKAAAEVKQTKVMSSFGGSSTWPFDDDGYLGYDPRLQSQRFNFDVDSVKDSAGDSPIFSGSQS